MAGPSSRDIDTSGSAGDSGDESGGILPSITPRPTPIVGRAVRPAPVTVRPPLPAPPPPPPAVTPQIFGFPANYGPSTGVPTGARENEIAESQSPRETVFSGDTQGGEAESIDEGIPQLPAGYGKMTRPTGDSVGGFVSPRGDTGPDRKSTLPMIRPPLPLSPRSLGEVESIDEGIPQLPLPADRPVSDGSSTRPLPLPVDNYVSGYGGTRRTSGSGSDYEEGESDSVDPFYEEGGGDPGDPFVVTESPNGFEGDSEDPFGRRTTGLKAPRPPMLDRNYDGSQRSNERGADSENPFKKGQMERRPGPGGFEPEDEDPFGEFLDDYGSSDEDNAMSPQEEPPVPTFREPPPLIIEEPPIIPFQPPRPDPFLPPQQPPQQRPPQQRPPQQRPPPQQPPPQHTTTS